MSNLLKKDKGFTLIEIVLVMAIAGLLLVIVFLAVQGAQRSRRDTQRKEDAARMLSAMEQCASNNNGSYATCLTTAQLITANYFTAQDPGSQATYTIVNTAPAAAGQIRPTTSHGGGTSACGGTASVQVFQEAGAAYCVHN